MLTALSALTFLGGLINFVRPAMGAAVLGARFGKESVLSEEELREEQAVAALRKLPTVPYRAEAVAPDGSSLFLGGSECALCLEPLVEGEMLRQLPVPPRVPRAVHRPLAAQGAAPADAALPDVQGRGAEPETTEPERRHEVGGAQRPSRRWPMRSRGGVAELADPRMARVGLVRAAQSSCYVQHNPRVM